MVVTDDWLKKYRTPRGGYTREQFGCLGIAWPAPRGWKLALIGREIADAAARKFERLAGLLAPSTERAVVTADCQIWTDGSCYPNPGPGGWAWHDGKGRFEHGGEVSGTNNSMELTAILRAMQAQPNGASVVIFSDSQYCVNGLTIWKAGWKRKAWMKKGEPMPNRDLWMALDRQQARINASFEWVRGHNGDAGNELADRLAAAGRESVAGMDRDTAKENG